jgi:hypothetical protein
MNWWNPPVGTFTIDEYLEMHHYWMDATSANRNKLSVRADPLKKKFFGDKRLTVYEDHVILEALHDDHSAGV